MKKSFSVSLLESLAGKHLLKHPFYQAWSAGELSKDALKAYARQYYHHVAAFPRYISATHSQCEDLNTRQELLRNLNDEEQGAENHPELWLRFAEGLDESRDAVKSEKLLPETRALIDTFFKHSRASYAEGLGALIAYEHQVPEVAASKINGLEKFYGVRNERSLQFFKEHLTADVYHTQACSELLDRLSPEEQEQAYEAAQSASQALWGFLDGIQRATGTQTHCA